MKDLAMLERRIESLESRVGRDPLELAFDKLTDNELGVLEQYMQLAQAGFSAKEIEGKMSREAYELALEIVEKVNLELVRLQEI